ncbi:hypothetical protein [Bradyrhizobium sp. HKCCYLRH1030]|uniref:hypothetical protein n=1 Tax=Bradyrhizobium sp. HKCCYLRH1030 TaxID=3420744 RepID=UPI003EC0B312
MSARPLARLAQVLHHRGPLIFALGGSSTTQRRNRTSDTDLFAIAGRDQMSDLVAIAGSFPRADLELRDLDWLDSFCTRLSSYRPSINAGPSPFSFVDLRFLARVLLGTEIVSHSDLRRRLESCREPLRVALATYMSSYYVSTFEDVAGLYFDHRHEDALLVAGELAQRACLLGLLQIELVDPAPKWSFAIAREGRFPSLTAAAAAMQQHLGAFGKPTPNIWVQSLLKLANRLVATGILAANDEGESAMPSSPLANSPAVNAGLCVMGVPGFQTLLDVSTNKISVCNRVLLHDFATYSLATS